MHHKKIPQALIKIKPSKIIKDSVGLFAIQNLKKGTIIGDAKHFKEKFHPWSAFKNLDKKTQKRIREYCVGTPNGFFAPPNLNYMSIPWHMNHSCDGNVGFDEKGNFVTIKNVKAKGELCWDYGLMETNPKFRMKCFCNTKNCRKIITGNDWRLLRQQPDKAIYMSVNLMNKKND